MIVSVLADTKRGSSPLTRGKPDGKLRTGGMSRLIPAHAGKTPEMVRRPHCEAGSSPLTRGKLDKPWWTRERRGLIPAHAGKTGVPHDRRHGSPAHPRSRGENALMRAVAADRIGSSPLTRGKPTYNI